MLSDWPGILPGAVLGGNRWINEATCERIVEPFLTAKPVGTGAGSELSVVYGIVEAHDGTISVASELGKGRHFDTVLPIAEAIVACRGLSRPSA